MKKLRLKLVLIILLAVIAAILILHNSNSTFNKAYSDFAIDDTSSVTKIFLADKSTNQVTLTKVSPMQWTVNNKYPASVDEIKFLLKTMMNLEVKAPVPRSMFNNVVKRMASIGVKVEIYQWVYRINLFDKIKLFPHEKLTKVYYVGDNTRDLMGTYMMIEGASSPFVIQIPGLNGYLSTRYTPKEIDWRSHAIFKYNYKKIKNITLQYPQNNENSFSLTINRNNIELRSLQDNHIVNNFDTLKVFKYLSSFDDIRFEAFENDLKQKDSILKTIPFHILTVTDVDGNSITIKTFHRNAKLGETEYDGTPIKYDRDRLYALINGGKDLVLIQFFVFDNVLRPLNYFTE